MRRAQFLSFLIGGLTASTVLADTYSRFQGFAEPPRNWQQTRPTQLYGWDTTTIAGGRGAGGGLLQPTTFFNFYGDTFLNGVLTRDVPVSAGGQIAVTRTSGQPPYAATAYIGHFAKSPEPYINVLGMAMFLGDDNTVEAAAIIQFADGKAYAGKSVSVKVSTTRSLDWSYAWDPNGGPNGQGNLRVSLGGKGSSVNLVGDSRGSDLSLDTFGIFQPGFTSPDSRSFLQLFIGQTTYTANIGNPPVIKVRGAGTIRTRTAVANLTGRATVAPGNRVVRVRYRLLRRGSRSRFRTTVGTSNWKASVRVQRGASRVEILARSDDGTVATTQKRIRRLP